MGSIEQVVALLQVEEFVASEVEAVQPDVANERIVQDVEKGVYSVQERTGVLASCSLQCAAVRFRQPVPWVSETTVWALLQRHRKCFEDKDWRVAPTGLKKIR